MTHPKLVDVGTGSGCIALSLAHELQDADVYAVDVSVEALEIARANAARLQLDGRVRFLQCNVLRPMAHDSSTTAIPSIPAVIPSEDLSPSRGTSIAAGQYFRELDFVVSNPPYVGFGEADKVQKSVRDFEPQVAVFAGEQGLDVIRPADRAGPFCLETRWLASHGNRLLDARCRGESTGSHTVG